MSFRDSSSLHFQGYNHDSLLGQGKENDDDDEEVIGIILSRRILLEKLYGLSRREKQSTSMLHNAVRKTVSMRAAEKQNTSSVLESSSAVRRTFPIRATPAVSQADCRIENEYDSVSDIENLLAPKAQAQPQNTVFINNQKRNKVFQVRRRFFCLKN